MLKNYLKATGGEVPGWTIKTPKETIIEGMIRTVWDSDSKNYMKEFSIFVANRKRMPMITCAYLEYEKLPYFFL